MKQIFPPFSKVLMALLAVGALSLTPLHADDGHRLWLRQQTAGQTRVAADHESPIVDVARRELATYCRRAAVSLKIDASMPDDDGYRISGDTIAARRDAGLLYGSYALLRQQALAQQQANHPSQAPYSTSPTAQESHPTFALRLLNHWDNLDGSIERGYAGESIFEWFHLDEGLIREYARANASIGINGSVLNNVNASPKMLTADYLKEVKKIADLLRPYGIRAYLSINFATPKALGDTKTADPLDKTVARWWQRKAKEIYRLIPDFGGFLVKANSEGQPGPFDYGRSHADGANMLADALKPYGGIVMWRCFVYGSKHKGEDRVMQAVSEFKPLDGTFRDNVILQTKNGPLDFQPREPYSPIFDQIRQTPNMVELQITQEYLGQSRHLVYLAPMWREFFDEVSGKSVNSKSVNSKSVKSKSANSKSVNSKFLGVAGVANIGKNRNWCGHHFSQANWYAFGRLAWDAGLSSEQIAREWLMLTFVGDEGFVGPMTRVMMESREACVDYMMPLGLHHIFKFDHHYGPEPDGFKADYPIEWCPVYYHKADRQGIGFDRSSRGTGATRQYREDVARLFDDPQTCPEKYLLWFHHLPWTYRMKDGSTLWESLQYHYHRGVITVEGHHNLWHTKMRHFVDEQRWREVDERLQHQVENAREWRDVCLRYFASMQQ